MRTVRLVAVVGAAASMALGSFAQPPQPSESTTSKGWEHSDPKQSTPQWRQQRGTLSDVDERALRDRVDSFVAALNRHDVSAIGPFLAADADIVTPTGKVVQGRDSIETMMSRKEDKGENCRLNLSVSSIRGFGDVALVDLDGTVTGPTMGTWWHDDSRMGQTYSTRNPDADRSGAPSTSSPKRAPKSDRDAPDSTPARDPKDDGNPKNLDQTRRDDGTPNMEKSRMDHGRDTLKTHVTLVMRRERGDWMIEAGRPSVLPLGMKMDHEPVRGTNGQPMPDPRTPSASSPSTPSATDPSAIPPTQPTPR